MLSPTLVASPCVVRRARTTDDAVDAIRAALDADGLVETHKSKDLSELVDEDDVSFQVAFPPLGVGS